MPALVEAALAKAVTIPSATIHAHVDSLRRRNPEATPEQLVRLLEKEYLLVVQGAGGAVGASAAAPAVGTGVALVLTASDVATFFAASAAFSLAVASVHGIEVEDSDRRRALLLTTILGDSGGKIITDGAELTSVSVARALLTRMPMATVRKVNTTMTRRLVRTQLTKQTGLAVGRLIPFGIGLVVGVAGARALGKNVIEGARKAFGPPPLTFPKVIEIAGPNDTPVILPAEPKRLTGRFKRIGSKK
ncbi:hypothetical protein [Cellulomonas sp. Root137]|uniref:hypothetical protein n=1 Tax=Cellulomonas sp. Root137 TaxID=1736459 RepID=UPI0007014BE4|nr:hypothetical protein [Cellulomonas sp. Root137]KQY42839.1 hypothetical protein ASD18_17785 [Cellulomonas sp. Root137]KRD43079.1 hypothetical protein ASE38_02020 [Cellulomonas sp. Root930]